MYTHIIDRSNLDKVVRITRDGEKLTQRQSLERSRHHRADIVLLNGTRSNRQYLLEVTPTGFTGDLWILDILSDEQLAQIEGIARRMRQNALDFPPASLLLR